MSNFLSWSILLLLFCFSCTSAPPPTEVSILERAQQLPVSMKDKTALYVNDQQSDDLFYQVVAPKDLIKGTLVLLPPTAHTVENVLSDNETLIAKATEQHLLVVVPSLNYNMVIDEVSLAFLNAVFDDLLTRFKVPEDKFIMGGFSLGGINAVRYTEYAMASPDTARIHPLAVFAVDPPLDLARLYKTFERTVEKNFSEVAINEAAIYLKKMNARFGGSPEEQPAAYIQYSPYARHAAGGGNAKYLKETPVRIYADVDTEWYLKKRRVDFYDMNALDQTAMINELQLMGNDRAEFINAFGKGYRPNGDRHPHSWSLIEPQDLIDWIHQLFK